MGGACGSVPVAAFTITKLSWLHRVGARRVGARRARVPAARLAHVEAHGRVRRPTAATRRAPATSPPRATSTGSTCSRSSTTTPTGRRGCRGCSRPTEPAGTTPALRARRGRRARAPATTWPPRSALALAARRRRDLARHVGHGLHGERDADRRPDRRGRGLRRRDRPLPPARVHAQRDEGHRHDRAAARRRPRGARRARARRRRPARTA